MPVQEHEMALSTRVAVAQAMQEHRCGANADHYALPQLAPRARPMTALRPRLSGIMWRQHVCSNGGQVQTIATCYAHGPYLELLYRGYYERFRSIGRLDMADFSYRAL